MGAPRSIRDHGPFTGQVSAPDLGEIPPGASTLQLNMVNEAGNPGVLVPRRGMGLLAHEDRLPATQWVTATAYVAEYDFVYQGGQTYRCLVSHTSAAAFLTDLQALRWRLWPSMGIVVEGAPSDTASALVQVTTSGGVSLLIASFIPRSLLTMPPEFQIPEAIPDPEAPLAAGAPEYAYLYASVAGGTKPYILQIDINPTSATASNARLTASMALDTFTIGTAAFYEQFLNGWLVKGPNNYIYWIIWSRDTTTGDAQAGYWTGVASSGASRRWENGYDSGSIENNFRASYVPNLFTLSSNMEARIIGDNDTRAKPKPTPPGAQSSTDIAYRFPAAAFDDPTDVYQNVNQHAILAKDGQRVSLRRWSALADNGYPEAHPLADGGVVTTVTSRSSATTPGIDVRVIGWPESGPSLYGNAAKVFTTSDQPADGSTASWYPSKTALASNNKVVVARGTSGATLWDFTTGASVDMTPGTVVGVTASHRSQRIYLAQGPAPIVIREYTFDGLATGRAWATANYPNLAYTYHGMFFDAAQNVLYVLTYNGAAGAGSRNLITGIPTGYPNWLPATFYNQGDMVVDSEDVALALYQAQSQHTSSGEFASDSARWTAKATTWTLAWGALPAAVEAGARAYVDSAGSQYRNLTTGLPL